MTEPTNTHVRKAANGNRCPPVVSDPRGRCTVSRREPTRHVRTHVIDLAAVALTWPPSPASELYPRCRGGEVISMVRVITSICPRWSHSPQSFSQGPCLVPFLLGLSPSSSSNSDHGLHAFHVSSLLGTCWGAAEGSLTPAGEMSDVTLSLSQLGCIKSEILTWTRLSAAGGCPILHAASETCMQEEHDVVESISSMKFSWRRESNDLSTTSRKPG